ncbi:MAG: hypothetical protein ACPGSO_05335 [Vicingaceae bacterium]
MKNWKFAIRLIGILITGFFLVKMSYQFKTSTFLFDFIIFSILSILGFLLLTWSLITDIKQFQKQKNISSLTPSILCIGFSILIGIINYQINKNFNKPTLIHIFYDGGFNGTGIDFKTDGTYIFDNSAIGASDYLYGKYTINGNIIKLDKNNLDDIVITDHLEIRPEESKHTNRNNTEYYVYQIDKNGTIIKNSTDFKLVSDNRK